MKRVVQLSVTDEEIVEFILKMNEAFFARASEKMPVSEIGIDDLKNQQELYALFDDDELVAGLAFLFETDGVYIKHVWCDIHRQGCGYASYLMDEVIKIAKERQYSELKLGVCCMYKPAVYLYCKKGFKIYAYKTHTPYTYCHYNMVKRLKKQGKGWFELKRFGGRVLSRIKHFLLFKEDGRPKWLYRVIYKK